MNSFLPVLADSTQSCRTVLGHTAEDLSLARGADEWMDGIGREDISTMGIAWKRAADSFDLPT